MNLLSSLIQKIYTSKTEIDLNTKESSEITNWNNPIYSYRPFNPDELYQRNGDYSTYDDMLLDEQVRICLSMKKDLILNSGWRIEHDNKELAKEIEISLENDPSIPLNESLEEILTAFDYGFSLSEKTFTKKEDGKVALKYIKTRNPESWEIHLDDFGNIQKYIQKNAKGDIEIPESSIIHFVNNRKFSNPYGESDLKPAFQPWTAKRHVIRMFAVFIEKAASPLPIAKVDAKAPQQIKDQIFEMIKRLQTKSAMVLPTGIEIEFLETKTTGEAYHKAINLFNMMIGRAMLTTDLLGIAGSETSGGSYSLGEKHFELFMLHIEKRRSAIERLINKSIIKPMVIWNYGFMDEYPQFKFNPISVKDRMNAAKVWVEAIKGNVFKPNPEEINLFRDIVGFPQGVVNEAIKPVMPQIGNVDKQKPQDVEDDISDIESDNDSSDTDQEDEKKSFKSQGIYKPVGKYDKKVDYAAINSQMDGYLSSLINESKPIIKAQAQDLASQIEKKKIIENQNIDKLEALSIKNLGKLKQAIKATFKEVWKKAYVTAGNELIKTNFAEPMLTDEYLKVLEQELTAYIGDYEYNLQKEVRQRIVEAIKDGTPVQKAIDDTILLYTNNAEVSLERFARTKLTELTNRGRMAAFEETGLVDAYQYSAVLDDRTSQICSYLHGSVFSADETPIPPMHFNCRSVLIPITKYEQWTPTEDFYKSDPDEGEVGSAKDLKEVLELRGKGFPIR